MKLFCMEYQLTCKGIEEDLSKEEIESGTLRKLFKPLIVDQKKSKNLENKKENLRVEGKGLSFESRDSTKPFKMVLLV